MAEERLIDTDKDKKYRIRKNADGEDELYIDDSQDMEQVEDVAFVVAEEGAQEKGANAAYAYSALSAKDEEQTKAEREKELNSLIEKARADCEQKKYATAVDYLEKAAELDPTNGEIYALRLVAYTKDFSDYSRVLVAQEYCEEVEKYTAEETKRSLFDKAHEGLEENIDSLTKDIEELSKENERQKQIRAKKFLADRNAVAVAFSLELCGLIILAALSIYYFANMYAVAENTNLIMAIVFAAAAVLTFIATAISLRKLLTACRRVRLNKSNSATQLGRELLATQARLNAFNAIYKALNV